MLKSPKLQRAFSRGLLCVRCARRSVWFRLYFCSRRERELASYHYCFARLDATFNHRQIALLALTRPERAKVDGVVRFHHKNKRPALANLDCLRRDQRRIFDQIENKTHPHKFGGPKCATGVGRYCPCFHCSRARLDRIVDEIEIASTRRD